jgi:4-amino-4-deoxy-L-arabinose transferase-like glycosyltransferase
MSTAPEPDETRLAVEAPSPATAGRALGMAAAAGAVALAYRVFLSRVYFGQEEEDWGTVGLILGAYQSGLRYIETEHMPLYIDLAGLATFLTGGDAEAGGELVSLVAGTFVVAAITFLGARWFSPLAGLVAGGIVAFQPESALYSATTLRVAMYSALVILGVGLIGHRRFPAAGVVLAAAFLTRFDAVFIFVPALALTVQWFRQKAPEADLHWTRRWEGAAVALGILLATAILWSGYYHSQEGTWAFWSAVGERNSEAYIDQGAAAKLGAGLHTLKGVLFKLLPRHLGWPLLLLAPVGAFLVLARVTANIGPARWLLFAGILGWGSFCSIVVVSAYHWDHNLYWKWLTPHVPYLVLLAVHGGIEALKGLARTGGSAMTAAALTLAGIGLLGTGAVFHAETTAQLDRSALWNGTQIHLARWFETHYEEDAGVLGALVPNTYLLRRPSTRRVNYWHDDGIPDDEPEAFGEYLLDQRIAMVVWFREDWVQAMSAAPFLAGGLRVEAGPVTLVPIAREDGYGFIAYRVEGIPGVDHPTEGPPAAAGAPAVTASPEVP